MRSRKVYFLIMFVVIALFLTLAVADAQAWSFGGVKDWIVGNALSIIITSALTLIGGFFGGTKWGKAILMAKVPIKELVDVAKKIHQVRRPTSPGGKDVTPAEKDAVLKEVEELVRAIVNTFGKGQEL